MFYDNNFGAPNTSASLGPYVIGVTVQKLLYVKASIGFGAAGSALSPSGQLELPITWGVQWQPHGTGPLGLPADIGSAQFVFSEQVAIAGFGGGVWAPSTDTAAVVPFICGTDSWRGQVFINDEVDLYVSYGYSGGSGLPDIYASHTVEAWVTY